MAVILPFGIQNNQYYNFFAWFVMILKYFHDNSVFQLHMKWYVMHSFKFMLGNYPFSLFIVISPPNEVGGGYTGFTLSVRPSVRLSVDYMVSGA